MGELFFGRAEIGNFFLMIFNCSPEDNDLLLYSYYTYRYTNEKNNNKKKLSKVLIGCLVVNFLVHTVLI